MLVILEIIVCSCFKRLQYLTVLFFIIKFFYHTLFILLQCHILLVQCYYKTIKYGYYAAINVTPSIVLMYLL